MTRTPDMPTRRWYALLLVVIGTGILVAALSSLRRATEANLGLLEGVVFSDTGEGRAVPVRVLVLDTGTRDRGGPVSAPAELGAWIRFLDRAGFMWDRVGLDALPRAPDQADVLVVPWGQWLPSDFLVRLGEYLRAGGGLVVSGPRESRLAGGEGPEAGSRAIQELETGAEVGRHPPHLSAWLSLLFDGEPGRTPRADLASPPGSPRARMAVRAVAGDLLEFVIPPGRAVRVPRVVVERSGSAACARPLAVAVPDRLEGAGREVCVVAAKECDRGRAIWMGFPLTLAIGPRDLARHLEELVEILVRWAAGRPVARVAPWPGSPGGRVGVGVLVDDLAGAETVAEMLASRGMQATWFLPDTLLLGDTDGLVRPWSVGEVGWWISSRVADLPRPVRRSHLVEVGATLRLQGGGAPVGALGTFEQREQEVLKDLVWAGFDHFVPLRRSSVLAPSLVWNRGMAIVKFPGTVLDLGRPPASRWEFERTMVARFRHSWPGDGGEPVGIVCVRSHVVSDPTERTQLADLFDSLMADGRHQVASVGQLAVAWRQAAAVDVRCEGLRPDRLLVQVSGRGEPLQEVRVHFYMAHTRLPGAVDTHQLRPPPWRLEHEGAYSFVLAVDLPEPERIRSFFIQRVQEGERARGGASESCFVEQ